MSDITSRMYPDEGTQDDPAPVTSKDAAVEAEGTGEPTQIPISPPAPDALSSEAMELVTRPADLAQRMFAEGGVVPDDPAQYSLASVDHLLREAIETGNNEDVHALTTGFADATELLHEMAVPRVAAREITSTLGKWHGLPPLTGEQLAAKNAQTEKELRSAWGSEYNARFELAKRASKDAMQRLPWLQDLLLRGAGSEPSLIKHFADVGLRNARKSLKR